MILGFKYNLKEDLKLNILEAIYLAGIIDGEGSILLTRIHKGEHRRPCTSISSSDIELLIYLQAVTGGHILNKKITNPINIKTLTHFL